MSEYQSDEIAAVGYQLEELGDVITIAADEYYNRDNDRANKLYRIADRAKDLAEKLDTLSTDLATLNGEY